jgi:nifR3 family TIM-barrel protein
MELGFWLKLKKISSEENKPIIVMAPMADVTDTAFREIIAKYSKPVAPHYVTWTEFVSADGLIRGGYEKLIRDLEYTEYERPIVAQLFTSNPEIMEQAAKLVLELGFDGLDINMGCPDKSIEKQGAGAALIKTPELAVAVIKAAQKGVDNKIPVSVKTRIGYNKNELETWLPILLSAEPAVVTIHARTRKEMSKVPARWEEVRRAVEIRNKLGSKSLIFGNGDIETVDEAQNKFEETGADGVMIGRGIFGNPWVFAGVKRNSASVRERLNVLVEHTMLFEKKLGDIKSFAIMKKHYKAYCDGFDGAKELRTKLMDCNNALEVEKLVAKFLATHSV